ncbi:hypothetical protein LINGRAHAP2_LOCUS21964 [Linum grandiflorum]
MDVRRVVVVVEESESAKSALRWALHNFIRGGDILTLLHVFSPTKKKMQRRLLRVQGFQLALSFKEICNDSAFFNTNVEIIVTEGDGGKIVEMVREIGASALVAGLHDHSFLYRLAMTETNLSCKVLAIKHRESSQLSLGIATSRSRSRSSSTMSSLLDASTDHSFFDFSQIEICSSTLEAPEASQPKIPYRVCPGPYSILWRWRRKSS